MGEHISKAKNSKASVETNKNRKSGWNVIQKLQLRWVCNFGF